MLKNEHKQFFFFLPIVGHFSYALIFDRSSGLFALLFCEFLTVIISKRINVASWSVSRPGVSLYGAFLILYQIFFWGVPRTFYSLRNNDSSSAMAFLLCSILVPLVTGISWRQSDKVLARFFRPKGKINSNSETCNRLIFRFVALLLLVSLAIVMVYFAQVRSTLALWGMLSGERYEELLLLRQGSMASLTPSILPVLVQFVRDFLLPLCVIFSLCLSASRGFLRDRFLVATSFIFALIVSLSNLEKSPIVNLLLLTILAVSLLRREIPYRLLVASVFAGGIAVVGLVKVSNAADRTLLNLFEGIFRRTALAPAEVAGQYFLWAPGNSGGFLRGAGLPFLHNFSPRGTIDAASVVYTFMRPADTLQGSANGAFFSMAWVEFGWTSALLSMVLVGFMLALYERVSLHFRHEHVSIALLCLVMVSIVRLYSTSVTSSLLGVGFSLIDTVLLLLIFDRFSTRAQQPKESVLRE